MNDIYDTFMIIYQRNYSIYDGIIMEIISFA